MDVLRVPVHIEGVPVRRRRRGRLGSTAVGALLLTVAACPTPASAHGGTDSAGMSNYRTRILAVTPSLPGLKIVARGVDGLLVLTNDMPEDVIVLGYDDEPYLRVGPDGVFANLNSPATYVNGRRDANVPIPDHATSTSVPDWYRISTGHTASWHDHRVHWMGSVPPPAVQADPGSRYVVNPAWTIPLLAGATAVTVTGDLTWVPPPKRSAWLLGALLVFLIAVLALQVARWSGPLTVVAAALGLAAAVVIAAGRFRVARDSLGWRMLLFVVPALIAIAVGLVVARARHERGHRGRDDPALASALTGLLLLGNGSGYLRMLSYSQIASSVGPPLNRLAVIAQLGVGAALVTNYAVRWWERRSAPRAPVEQPALT